MLKKRKGFTLFEAIISIVLLSVSSIIILQIFYTAGNLSRKATDLDIANSVLSQAIGISKNAVDVTEFFNDGEVFENRVSVTSLEEVYGDNVEQIIYVYYDKDWNTLEKSSQEIPDETKFIARYELVKENVYYDEKIIKEVDINNDKYTTLEVGNGGVLYTINGTISNIQKSLFDSPEELERPIITSLSGSKYIGNTERN